MCIAVYKPAGASFPAKSEFKTMWNNNPDGAGYMFADGSAVHIRKGFMNFESFYRSFRRDSKKCGEACAWAFHFRIATHGGITPEMTQPFPLSRATRELKKLRAQSALGIAHNGIISMTADARDISDTALFISRHLTRIIRDANKITQADIDIISACIDSKMILLHPDGRADLIGSFKKDSGRYYSNSSYQDAGRGSCVWDNWRLYGYQSEAEYLDDLRYYSALYRY